MIKLGPDLPLETRLRIDTRPPLPSLPPEGS